LTGAIGAGKSEALAALARLGAATLSSDEVVHELYGTDDVRDAVVARYGPEVAPGGVVDRAALATRVFASEEERRWLEGVLWPLVGARVAAWRAALEQRDPAPVAAVVEVPLLFEAGMDALFDATLAITAPEELRAVRVAARGHAALAERSARQLPAAEKARRATYVVANEGTLGDLEQSLSEVLRKHQAMTERSGGV